MLDIHECPQVFILHGAEPWYGNDRWVVVAYTPLNSPEAFIHNKQSLADLGFPLPDVQHLGTELHAGGMEGLRPQKFVEDSSISKFKVNPVSIAGTFIEKGQLHSKGIKEESSWVVEFPHELSLTFEDGVRLRQISLGCCLQLAQELPGSMIEGDGFEVVRLMKVARLEVLWWEAASKLLQPAMETCFF